MNHPYLVVHSASSAAREAEAAAASPGAAGSPGVANAGQGSAICAVCHDPFEVRGVLDGAGAASDVLCDICLSACLTRCSGITQNSRSLLPDSAWYCEAEMLSPCCMLNSWSAIEVQ